MDVFFNNVLEIDTTSGETYIPNAFPTPFDVQCQLNDGPQGSVSAVYELDSQYITIAVVDSNGNTLPCDVATAEVNVLITRPSSQLPYWPTPTPHP
jgi:hypothetical protein